MAGSIATSAAGPDQPTLTAPRAEATHGSPPPTTTAPAVSGQPAAASAAPAAVQRAAVDLSAVLAPVAPIVRHLLANLSDPHAVVADVLAVLGRLGGHVEAAAARLHRLIDQLEAMHAVRPDVAAALHRLVELTETSQALKGAIDRLPAVNAALSVLGGLGLLTGLPRAGLPPIPSVPAATEAVARSPASVVRTGGAAHATRPQARASGVAAQAPGWWIPGSPSAGAGAGGAAGALLMPGAIAALLAALGLTVPRGVGRVCAPPACRRTVAACPLEQPG